MAMSLEEWDRRMKPILQDIEVDATWVRIYADKIYHRTSTAPEQPDFDTIAIDEAEKAVGAINAAIKHMITSRDIIIKSIEGFKGKPRDA